MHHPGSQRPLVKDQDTILAHLLNMPLLCPGNSGRNRSTGWTRPTLAPGGLVCLSHYTECIYLCHRRTLGTELVLQ